MRKDSNSYLPSNPQAQSSSGSIGLEGGWKVLASLVNGEPMITIQHESNMHSVATSIVAWDVNNRIVIHKWHDTDFI